jgi:hypothetical protein
MSDNHTDCLRYIESAEASDRTDCLRSIDSAETSAQALRAAIANICEHGTTADPWLDRLRALSSSINSSAQHLGGHLRPYEIR